MDNMKPPVFYQINPPRNLQRECYNKTYRQRNSFEVKVMILYPKPQVPVSRKLWSQREFNLILKFPKCELLCFWFTSVGRCEEGTHGNVNCSTEFWAIRQTILADMHI